MEYLGNILTYKGLQVSDDKVEAIGQASRPKHQSELRSFHGLVQYCARFIPSFEINYWKRLGTGFEMCFCQPKS